jgi:hypothetical protein
VLDNVLKHGSPKVVLSEVGHSPNVNEIKFLYTYLGCYYFKFSIKLVNSQLYKNEYVLVGLDNLDFHHLFEIKFMCTIFNILFLSWLKITVFFK